MLGVFIVRRTGQKSNGVACIPLQLWNVQSSGLVIE